MASRCAPVLGGLLLLLAACAHREPAREQPPTTALFDFHDSAIVESSGIVSSSRSDRLVYTHNDSGDGARFFAVDFDGCTVARYTITGASATDWEDVAHSRGPDGMPTLWFGDIGDNLTTRASVQVYAVTEPHPQVPDDGGVRCPPPRTKPVSGTRYDLVYPDGPHNAEALMADPLTSRLYVVTKPDVGTDRRPTLYGAPRQLDQGQPNRLRKLAVLRLPGKPAPRLITGADFAPDRRFVVVRTYTDAYEWPVYGGDVAAAMSRDARHIDVPAQPQGEAIGYSRTGDDLLVSSEDPLGTSPAVYLVRR